MNTFQADWNRVVQAQDAADKAITNLDKITEARHLGGTDKDPHMSTDNTTTTPAANELPAGTVEEQVTWIVSLITGHEAEIAEHAAEAKKHAAEIDSLKAQLRDMLPVGKHTFGNNTVTIANPARSFDSKAFMTSYPVEMNPALYKAVIDTAALPPKLKEQFMAAGTGDTKVTVK